MCGLLAYFSTDADRVLDETVEHVRGALHCLHHRGPDDTKVWSDPRAVLGFNRLSIIDIAGRTHVDRVDSRARGDGSGQHEGRAHVALVPSVHRAGGGWGVFRTAGADGGKG